MFGWFKRRVVFEHKKLVYLNKVSTIDPEMESRLFDKGLSNEVEFLIGLRDIANEMDHMGVPEDRLPDDLFELGLGVNRNMLDLFKVAYDQPIRKFEKKYRPMDGWKCYFGR